MSIVGAAAIGRRGLGIKYHQCLLHRKYGILCPYYAEYCNVACFEFSGFATNAAGVRCKEDHLSIEQGMYHCIVVRALSSEHPVEYIVGQWC